MDLEYLLKNASNYVYQLRKFFKEDEMPVNHYVCKEHVVFLSTKSLYILYFRNFYDYEPIKLSDSVLYNINEDNLTISTTINNKEFNIEFDSKGDYDNFFMYYKKYKK